MNTGLRRIASGLVYPTVMLVCIGSFYGLQAIGFSAFTASYMIAALGGLGLITILEFVLPYRLDWQPKFNEIRLDMLFMLLVQVLLPKALTLWVVVMITHAVGMQSMPLIELWPHRLPDWLQMLLMLMIADLFRYWLHRLAHEWKPLWRFHAVHHSVDKLYWLNVGRFHPLDKILQFLFDALPFILLGVAENVLALYFVVYAVNGFFQHSNIDVKLGVLNYLVSGPELHRWHHSKQVSESNRNYGNNLIIWDLVFGTYFLPRHRKVSALGLLRLCPTDFVGQMKMPFKRAEGSHDVA